MLNLRFLLLLAFITISLQDNNCLIYFEACEKKPQQSKIEHCQYSYPSYINGEEEEEICGVCDNGYVPSNDWKNCNQVKNPIAHCIRYYLYSEELICSECENDYAISKDGKTCKEFKGCYYSYDGECQSCKSGYAISYDRKSCKQFENCSKLEQGDAKCSKCVEFFHPNSDGKCERTLCEEYDDKDVCTLCFEGYYLNKDKQCQKIAIENCLVLDEQNEKCKKCLGGISPDNNGKCNLPSSLIKGCTRYGDDGKCLKCEEDDYTKTSDGNCRFIDCQKDESKVEYCAQCKAGYYFDDDDLCTGFDGSKDTSSFASFIRNKFEYTFLIFILAFMN